MKQVFTNNKEGEKSRLGLVFLLLKIQRRPFSMFWMVSDKAVWFKFGTNWPINTNVIVFFISSRVPEERYPGQKNFHLSPCRPYSME